MKFTDNELEQAAKQLCLSIAASVSQTEEGEGEAFSPAFEEKMALLLKKRRRLVLLKRISASAAAVLLLLVMGSSLLLAFDLEARATVRSWFRTVSEKRYTYHFTENRQDGELPRYEITALPEGYVLSGEDDRGSSHVLYYRKKGSGRYITPLSLEYLWISEDFSTAIVEDNYHELTAKAVEVNGIPADLYVSHPHWASWRSRTLFWVDEDAGIVFRLQGRLGEEDIIAVAESIRPVD